MLPLPWAHSTIQRVWTRGKFEIEWWIVVLICGYLLFQSFSNKIKSLSKSLPMYLKIVVDNAALTLSTQADNDTT